MDNFKRAFYSGTTKCKNGCLYCFSSLDLPFFYYDSNCHESNNIIYPSCDSDFFAQDLKSLNRIIDLYDKQSNHSVMSISTKSAVSHDVLRIIDQYNRSNLNNNIIKLSVSITNKNMVDLIEPRALSYEERLKMISAIQCYYIPTCVIIKPLLPFLKKEEYFTIIDDCINFTKDFVLGGLYVDINSQFYDRYIKNNFLIEERYCSWQNKTLPYVQHPDFEIIVDYIIQSSGLCYNSDEEYINKKIRGAIFYENK